MDDMYKFHQELHLSYQYKSMSFLEPFNNCKIETGIYLYSLYLKNILVVYMVWNGEQNKILI